MIPKVIVTQKVILILILIPKVIVTLIQIVTLIPKVIVIPIRIQKAIHRRSRVSRKKSNVPMLKQNQIFPLLNYNQKRISVLILFLPLVAKTNHMIGNFLALLI